MSTMMSPAEMEALLPEAERVAARNHVKLYRERDLVVTDLFPRDVARGKEVLLIHQGATLEVVEFATLSWVHWFNTTRLLEPLGYHHPAEFEAQHYDTITPRVMQAVA